jgi:hypothetical protein
MEAQRALKDIEMDLSHALRGKTSNMLEIGKLLNEAKTLVERGEWLPWLRRHTALPARTAQQRPRLGPMPKTQPLRIWT